MTQADNQVVCTQYRIQKSRNNDELNKSLRRIANNNNEIMKALKRGTRLGLIINKDETLQSADYLVQFSEGISTVWRQGDGAE